MRLTDDEFVRSHPMPATEADATIIDDPRDQPAYVGVLVTGPSSLDPRTTLRYPFKLTGDQARQLAASLTVAADGVD
jgi:hypothetical protein